MKRLFALLLVWSVCLGDALSTLAGQPKEYWQHYQVIEEANLASRFMLAISPFSFCQLVLIWMFILLSFTLFASKRIYSVVLIAATVAHAFGIWAWWWTIFHYPQTSEVLIFAVAAAVGLIYGGKGDE
jgi:hypothetical protein